MCARCGFMGPYYLPSVPYLALGKGFLLFICFEFEWFISYSKWIQIKKLSTTKFHNFQDLQLSFWYFLHPMLFTKFEFWISEVQTYFSLRRWFQIKKNSTTKLFNFWRSTTFILVFFSFDTVVVILFTNLISLIYSFWNYIRELLILWTNLLSLYQKIKN